MRRLALDAVAVGLVLLVRGAVVEPIELADVLKWSTNLRLGQRVEHVPEAFLLPASYGIATNDCTIEPG